MNVLSFDRQIAVISALTEGCSIRATERLTGIHRDTIMRLAARIGFGAIKFHDRIVHSFQVPRVELDEAWSFVKKKQRKVKPTDGRFVGDQYVFLGASATAEKLGTVGCLRTDQNRLASGIAMPMPVVEPITSYPQLQSLRRTAGFQPSVNSTSVPCAQWPPTLPRTQWPRTLPRSPRGGSHAKVSWAL